MAAARAAQGSGRDGGGQAPYLCIGVELPATNFNANKG
jgi:hypothetical protein